MSNFRAPANILLSTLLHKAPYSSNCSEKAVQELLKLQNVVEDKIKSEQIKNLLPHLQDKEKECTLYTMAEHQPISTHSDLKGVEKTTSELKHTTDIQPEFQKKLYKGENMNEAKDQNILEVPLSSEVFSKEMLFCDTCENTKDSPESRAATEVFQIPLSLPVLMVKKVKTPTMDLSNAMLPLSLHLKDKHSFLVDAVVQDLKQVYFKTSHTIDEWNKAAKTQKKSFYTKAEKLVNDPAVQKFLRERVVSIYSLQSRNSLSIFDPKSIAVANIDKVSGNSPYIAEKIKESIEKIIAKLKKFLNKESKPAAGEKKGKEEKKEEKAEKKAEAEGEKAK